jgi:hypothetical protein
MRHVLNALTSPFHIALLLIVVAASIVFLTIDFGGWGQPDYRRLCFLLVLAYVVGVLFELRSSVRPNRKS